MAVIWKFDVGIADGLQEISTGLAEADIVHVGIASTTPKGHLSMWVAGRPIKGDSWPSDVLKVKVVGTGEEWPKGDDEEYLYYHVGTVFMGPFVWHLLQDYS